VAQWPVRVVMSLPTSGNTAFATWNSITQAAR
jgi:hypothetical protein